MKTTGKNAVEGFPQKDFLIKDYELKIRYLSDHFSRMWTRFYYFVGIESAIIGGKLLFGDQKVLTPGVAIVGAVVSLIWYIMGAEDRFLVRVYRRHVKDAADLLARVVWDDSSSGPYRHVGEVAESSQAFHAEPSGWRWEPISTTRLAAWIPLLALFAWLWFLLAA